MKLKTKKELEMLKKRMLFIRQQKTLDNSNKKVIKNNKGK